MSRRRTFVGASAAFVFSPHISLAQVNRAVSDVVVLVPGIMGSVLERDGKTVWGIEVAAFVELLKQGNLDLQFLRPSAGILTATRVFESVTLIPGFWKLDGYTEMRRSLLNRLRLTPGRNYFEFPYDWRLDNRVAARKLKDIAENWLGEWREFSKDRNAQLVFVAHSMGGLVVRYATEVLGLWSKTRQVHTLGTPYRGSMKALSALTIGLLTPGLTKTVASFDSVYQLLPTYPCIESKGGFSGLADERPSFADLFDYDRFLRTGKTFHDECESAAKANAGTSSIQQRLFVTQANTHKTVSCARVVRGQPQILEKMGESDYLGDGTVPGFDLSQPQTSSVQENQYFTNQLHGSIQSSEDVADQVVNSILLRPFRSRGNDVVSMKVSDPVRLGSLLRVEIDLARRLRTSEPVSVFNAATGDLVAQTMLSTETLNFKGEFEISSAGVYRVAFGDPLICTDLACIA